jgi:hypothetical protein
MEVMAAEDSNRPGVARNATLYSVDDPKGKESHAPSFAEKCKWFSDVGVHGIASPWGHESDRPMTSNDFKVNEMVRKHNISLFISSGNNQDNLNAWSASFNSFCVGLVKHSGDDDWSNDSLYTDQGHLDPYSKSVSNKDSTADDVYFPCDRPHFCVPAGPSDHPSPDQQFGATSAAASMAAPICILIQKWLDEASIAINVYNDPNLVKAILLAASHRHVGDPDIEGTGTVDGNAVENIVKNIQFETVKLEESDTDTTLGYDIDLSGTVRMTCVWTTNLSAHKSWSKSDDNKTIHSDVDFDLVIKDSNGNVAAGSYNEDSSMEWLERNISSGTYTVEINNIEWHSDENSKIVRVAWETY